MASVNRESRREKHSFAASVSGAAIGLRTAPAQPEAAPVIRRVVWLLDGMRMGGAERMALAFAAGAPPPGWEIRLLSLQSLGAGWAPATAPGVAELGARGRLDLPAFLRLLGRLRRERAALLHVHLRTATLWGTAAGQMLQLPVIATLHVLPQPREGGRNAWLRRWEMTALNCMTRRVITLSRQQQHAWESAGLRRSLCRHLPHGINPAAASAAAGIRLRQELGIGCGEQLWLTVAVARDKKGWREWLEGVSQAMKTMRFLHCAWVGGGEGRERMRQLAEGQSWRGRLHLPGELNEVSAWLAAADGFVFPSREEVQPTALIEAMSAGLAIAVSALPSNREVLGEAGIYFAPGDSAGLATALLQLAMNAGWRKQLGEMARERYRQRYRFQNWQQHLYALYEETLAASTQCTATSTQRPTTNEQHASASSTQRIAARRASRRRLTPAAPRHSDLAISAARPRILMPEFFSCGGLYHYSLQLALALARQGASVRLLTGRDPELRPEHPPESFELRARLATWNPCQAASQGRFFQLARRIQHGALYVLAWARIIHEARRWRPDWILLGDLEHRCDAWGLRQLARCGPALADVWHNVQAIERNGAAALLKEQPWRDAMSRWLRVVFVHGDWARQVLKARLDLAAANKNTPARWRPKIVAIAHGDAALLRARLGPDPRLDDQLQLPRQLPLGLFFGALARYKGLDCLLAAMASLRAEERPALLIAGRAMADGALEAWREQARAAGLDAWLRWDIRYIPAEEAGWYFQRADFVCLPYRTITQSGVAHLALSWGKPMLASAVGGLREIVEPGNNGWLTPPGDVEALADALRQARTRPELLARFREAAQRRAAHHPGWDEIAAQILQAMQLPGSQLPRAIRPLLPKSDIKHK